MKYKFIARVRGVTMVELLVASTISAIILTGLFASLGTVYFSQKKINATQSFSSESRFLMEQIAQMVRNNTIDYDRFFVEVGPDDSTCTEFSLSQVPYELQDGELNPDDLTDPVINNASNREQLGYPNVFYWNIATGNIERYRNLGGKNPSAGDDSIDTCTQAWHGDLDTLFLINKERTERTALRLDATRLQKQRLLGVDTTNDGEEDSWGYATTWDSGNGICRVYTDENKLTELGIASGVIEEKTCMRGHDWTNISPESIEISEFEFLPAPNRDPYLNYRIDAAQIQPNVFLRLHTKLRRPRDFGIRSDEAIELIQQTMASSRVFGDPR